MEINYDILNADCTRELLRGQVAVECNMSSSDKISSVLGVSAYNSIVGTEALSGEATVSGRVNFRVLCADEEGKLFSLDYICDYKSEFKDSAITPDVRLLASGKVIESTATQIDDNSVKADAVVEIVLTGICKKEVKAGNSADLIVASKPIKTCEVSAVFEDVFDASEEIETKADVKNVLIIDTSIIVRETRCLTDIAITAGEISASISYTTENSVVTKNLTIPFNEESVALNATTDSYVDACATIKSARVVLEGVEGNNILRLEIIGKVNGAVLNVVEKQVLSDAYSLTNGINLERDCFEIELLRGQYRFEEHISNSSRLTDEQEPISRVLLTFVTGNNVASVAPLDDKIILSGLVNTVVVYTEDDNTIRSRAVEIPYSLQLRAEGVEETDGIRIDVAATEPTAVAKRARELEVMCLLKIAVRVYEKSRDCIVSAITAGAEKAEIDACMSIYVAEAGDSIFSVAKALNTTPGAVTASNPSLTEPLERGKKIAVFRPL